MINFSYLSKLSKLSKQEKILAYISCTVIFLLIGDYFVFQPIKERINTLARDISINEKKLEKNMRIIGLKEQVTSDYEKNISFIKMAGSDEEEIAKFLNAIEVLSRQSAISLVDMKPHVSREGDISSHKKYFVESEIEAPIDKIATFFHNLQKSTQLLRIEKFTLNTKGEAISEIIKGHLTITKIVIPE